MMFLALFSKCILCIQTIGLIPLMSYIFQVIGFPWFFRSVRSWHFCASDRSIAMNACNLCPAYRHAYCKCAGSCFHSNSMGFSMDGTLCSTNSIIIYRVSNLYTLSSLWNWGPHMITFLTSAFVFQLILASDDLLVNKGIPTRYQLEIKYVSFRVL